MPVSPAVAPPPGNPRFPLADSIRGIAVLVVVFVHAAGLSGSLPTAAWSLIAYNLTSVVALFFVLSGFLLYRPYASAHAGLRPAPALRDYLRRRALRILPAYWVALTLLALWPGLRGVFSDDWWIYYALLQNLSADTVAGGIPVAWSVCTEASFYVLLPLLAGVVTRAAPRRFAGRLRVDALVVAAFGAAGLGGRALIATEVLPAWAANALPGTALWLALGMALAVASVAAEREGGLRGVAGRVADHAWLPWVAAAAAFVVAWQAFDVYQHLYRPEASEPGPLQALGNHALMGLASALVVVPVVFGRGGAIRRLLAVRPLAYVGLVSYGVYLWHLPLSAWLAGYDGPPDPVPGTSGGPRVQELIAGHETAVLFVATLALSLVLAAVSYRFVELPFLRRKPGLRTYAAEAATPATVGASPAATSASSRAHVRA